MEVFGGARRSFVRINGVQQQLRKQQQRQQE